MSRFQEIQRSDNSPGINLEASRATHHLVVDVSAEGGWYRLVQMFFAVLTSLPS